MAELAFVDRVTGRGDLLAPEGSFPGVERIMFGPPPPPLCSLSSVPMLTLPRDRHRPPLLSPGRRLARPVSTAVEVGRRELGRDRGCRRVGRGRAEEGLGSECGRVVWVGGLMRRKGMASEGVAGLGRAERRFASPDSVFLLRCRVSKPTWSVARCERTGERKLSDELLAAVPLSPLTWLVLRHRHLSSITEYPARHLARCRTSSSLTSRLHRPD